MQLSKLTFSLASLIVIFALAFVATPVMAQVGVGITKYTGFTTHTDATSDAHVQTRADFRVQLTFDEAVEALAVEDVQVRYFNTETGIWTTTANVGSAPTAVTITGESITAAPITSRRYVVVASTTTVQHTKVEISIRADATRSATTSNGNSAQTETFILPTVLNADVSFGEPMPHPTDAATYLVDIIFTNNIDATTTATADDQPPISVGTNDLNDYYIDVTPDLADVTVGALTPVTAADPVVDDVTTGTSTYALTVVLHDTQEGTTTVTLSVDPGYATAAETAGTVTIPTPIPPPAAPAVTPEATTDSITLTWTAAATGAMYEYRQGNSGNFEDVTSPKTITGLEADTEYTFQVRLKKDGRTPAGMIATVTTSTNPPDPLVGITIPGTNTVPGGGYVVVVRDIDRTDTHLSRAQTNTVGAVTVTVDSIDIQEWSAMPDLATLFRRSAPGTGGGALVVKKSDDHTGNIGVGTVGISEIMWAWDEGAVFGTQRNVQHTREQWIELHNTNAGPVTVTLTAYDSSKSAEYGSALQPQSGEIDRVSNFNLSNAGGSWDVKGQSGDSALGKDFVSMARAKNGNPYSHGDNNGRNAGKWSASQFVYLRKASTLNSHLVEKAIYEFKGTPGRSNTIPTASAPTRTNVPNSPIIFNEIANRKDQEHELEWIELKNVSTAARDLRNYEISIITAVGTESRLYIFPNVDNQVIMQPGEVLLLVDTDPRYNDDHPIAVGYNVRGGNDQALGLGDDAPRYVVTDFAGNGLPDSGNFVLVLRTSKGDEGYADKKKTQDHLSDAVGWHSNLASTGHPLYTNLWPFKVYGAANHSKKWNMISPETVHYRQHQIDPDETKHGNRNIEHLALRDAGYTGVGYKRFANRDNPAHGGTPGYDHIDLIKTQAPHVGGGGVVTISEIMLDQGDARYPQWIELYNSSDSPVNLHADGGWRLVVENYDDGEIPVNRLSGTLNFTDSNVQTILPKQTVVVASTRARSSGSAFFDTSVIFPPARVFSVWDGTNSRGALGMTRTTDPILSTEGFYIELIDGKGNVSDSVGNLIDSPNRRVAAEKAWELSEVTGEMMEDAPRSSILRRYREPKGGDSRNWTPYTASELLDMGIMAEGWVLASKTSFREVRQTWYGHQTDVGSPGITGGRVLPVSLSKFRPERLDDGTVVIRWITESELNNAGFNILRSETRTGEFTQINTKLIAGHGTTSERNTYEFTDTSAKPNVVYYYQIQDVSMDGDVQALRITHLRGNVSAAGKLTTTWGELKLQD